MFLHMVSVGAVVSCVAVRGRCTCAYETRLYSMRGERNHKLCKLNIEHTSNRGVITESLAGLMI